jgi:hypothetical protein
VPPKKNVSLQKAVRLEKKKKKEAISSSRVGAEVSFK